MHARTHAHTHTVCLHTQIQASMCPGISISTDNFIFLYMLPVEWIHTHTYLTCIRMYACTHVHSMSIYTTRAYSRTNLQHEIIFILQKSSHIHNMYHTYVHKRTKHAHKYLQAHAYSCTYACTYVQHSMPFILQIPSYIHNICTHIDIYV